MTTRLIPEIPLPPYAYVPGSGQPHPISDPRGHSFGHRSSPESLDPNDWHRCRAYLYGLDLLNLGYPWEAHEHWEGLWHAAGRRGPLADFLRALIKIAAAGVKAREGQPHGVARHAGRAAELLGTIEAQGGRFCGLVLADLIALAEGIAREGWRPFALVPRAETD